MPFDLAAAKQSGYNDTDIANYLASKAGNFDIDGARKSGAADSDIAQYLSEKAQEAPKPQPTPEIPSVGRTAIDQSMQGATFGFGDEGADWLGSAYAKYAPKAIGGRPDLFADRSLSDIHGEARNATKDRLQSEWQNNPGTAIASNIAGSLLTGGAGAETSAGKAIASSLGRGGLAARVAKSAIAGSASGGLYGAGSADEGQRLEGAGQGALYGAGFGAALPAAGAALSGVKNAVLPHAEESIMPLAQKAIDMGIPLTRSQIGNSRFAKTLESTSREIPFSGAMNFAHKQQKAFNSAIARSIGEEADNLSPDVINSAYQNIGKKFDDVLKGQKIQIGDDVIQRLAQIESDAHNYITGDHFNIVKRNINSFLSNVADDGTINGEKIGSFRSALSGALRQTNNDASPYLKDLLETVMDASVNGAPARRELLDEARLQYRNLKTIEPLVAKAKQGDISPSLLQGAVTSDRTGKMLHARGKTGDIGDLARIGQQFLKEPPNSFTPTRLGAYSVLGGSLLNPVTAAIAAKTVGGAAAFNALNNSQSLVRGALQSSGRTLPRAAGVIPAMLEGQAAGVITTKPKIPTINITTPGGIPDVNLPTLGPQGNAGNDRLNQTLASAEGTRSKSYDDTTGNRTVGQGFNMDSPNARKLWRQAGIQKSFDNVRAGKQDLADHEINALTTLSVNVAYQDAKKLVPNLDNLPPEKRDALIEMSYQLGGPRLATFRPTISAIKNGNFAKAAEHLMKTKYAQQTPERVQRIARMLSA